MLKTSYKIRFTILLFLLTVPQSICANKVSKVKNIVIFFSLKSDMPAYQNILEGFRSVINEDLNANYNIISESLEIGQGLNDDYIQTMVKRYNEKFRVTGCDLLITVGPGTYPLLEKYGLEALENTKTIVIENENLKQNSNLSVTHENILKIDVKYNFSKTIKTAIELFPNNKNVYIICGGSTIDDYYLELVKQASKNIKNSYIFNFISNLSLDSTLKIVKEIPNNSVIMIASYVTDENNISSTTSEAIRIISSIYDGPVFTFYDTFIRKGGFGGYVFSYFSLGKETGKAARDILNGKPLLDVTINENNFYQHIYDWQQLKRWGLQNSKLIPASSIIYNKEFDIISEYGWYMLIGILFLIFETVLIGYLIRTSRRQKNVVMQKLEAESLYRQIVREDRGHRMVALTSSLSHELNQPLTAILYNAQAGKRFLKSDKLDSEQAEEIFDNIIQDNKRAASLISSVRSMMKLEKREQEKVNLNMLISETISLFNFEAVKKQIKIKTNLTNYPVFVLGDKIQLQQIILNFMFNASTAMDSTDPMNKNLEIDEILNQNEVTITVRDNGAGIDESIIARLFKPFTTTRKDGMGIGLAVSKQIIENHNGEIWAQNNPKGGAEFNFKLNVLDDEN